MTSAAETIQKLGIVRLGVMAAVLAGLAGFFFFLIARISSPEMTLLYGDLDPSDGARVVSKLEASATPYDIKGGGTQIYVPADQVARMRMGMAEAGIPTGGSIGYEIFDKGETLGTTSFVQNINRMRALEGELSRTIRTLSPIASARVHLVMPKKSLFGTQRDEPRASIVIKLQGPGRLSKNRVSSIQHLVASAVPGLDAANISIVDDRGNLLARGDKEANSMGAPLDIDEARFDYERRLGRSIEDLVGRIVGLGKVRAEVTEDLDFDRTTENSEIYDPDGRVVRSSQTTEEGNQSKEALANQGVSVQNNLPDAPEGEEAGGNSTQSNRVEEVVNYEISKTIRSHVRESGGIKHLSLAVLVDGNYTTNESGAEQYAPRTEEEMQKIGKLVKSAIGFSEERGDTVEVINMRFAPEATLDVLEIESFFLGLEKHQVIRLAEILILVFFGLLILLLVVKPLLSKAMEGGSSSVGEGQASPEAVQGAVEAHALAQAQTQAPEAGTMPAALAAPQSSELSQMIDLKKVEGQVRASSVQKIGDMINESPDEAVNIVRGWMNEKVG
ncbi:MAG: flagellar M-ring protein FliF [bacterium]|nr:flagellar M-ring protein FliF [bacterium]